MTAHRIGTVRRSEEIGPIAKYACLAFIVVGTLVNFEAIPNPPSVSYLASLVPFGVLLLVPASTVRNMTISMQPVLLAGWVALSTAWSFDPERTGFLVRLELPMVLGFVIVAAVLHEIDLMKFLLHAARVTLAISVLATILLPSTRSGIWFGDEVLAGWHGLFPHKNDMGPFLALTFGIVLAADHNRLTRLPTLAVTAVMVAGSQSVTALTTTLVLIAAYMWLRANRRVDDRLLAITVVSTLALATGAAMGARAGLPIFLEATGKDPTFSGRTHIWEAVIGAIGEKPWIGYGREGLFFSPPNDLSLELWREIGFRAPHSHNGLLDLVLQVGIIGLVLYGALFTSTVMSAVRSYRRHEDFGIFSLMVLASIAVASLSEPVFIGPYLALLSAIRIVGLRLDRQAELARLAAIASTGTSTGKVMQGPNPPGRHITSV
jgi:O-antigen ligase